MFETRQSQRRLLLSFKKVTSGQIKRKVKRHLDRSHPHSFHSMSGDRSANSHGQQGTDTSLPRPTQSVVLFPFPD